MDNLKALADYWRKVKSGELPAPGQNEVSITACAVDDAVSRITTLLAELEAAEQRAAVDHEAASSLVVELSAARERIAELEAKTSMTMGVGNGDGNLFVHGDYDSIKAAQRIVLDNEELRAKLATPVRLPEKFSMLHRTGFHEDYQSTMAFKADGVIAALREHGGTIEGDE